jgi:hypothetical protein
METQQETNAEANVENYEYPLTDALEALKDPLAEGADEGVSRLH